MKTLLTTAALGALLLLPAGAQSPMMGWSSWNTYRVHISDSLIRRQALTMARNGLKEAGYRYINIDDGAYDGRTPEGHLHAHATRFPQGLGPVVAYIHSLGLKAGTYSDAGHNTCGNYWDHDAGVGIGLYGHEQADTHYLFNELGFDFIKVDFCGGDPAQNIERLDLDEQTQYTAISRTLRAVARHEVRLNVCRWAFPGTWVTDVADSWRIAPDIQDSWESVKSIISRNLYLSAYASPGHYNDMDMLEVGGSLTPEQLRTHLAMWCIMSSPLLIGSDLTTLSAETLSLLTNPELLAVNQDPLGQQAHVVARRGEAYVLVKDLLTPHGRQRAVAFYNAGDSTVSLSIPLQQLGYGTKRHVSVRDVMERRDLPPCTASLSVSLPPCATRLYVLKGRRTETVRYEAENAWLSRYSAISGEPCAYVSEDDACSGGAKVSRLGDDGLQGNSLQWRHVYSRKGGPYRLTFGYSTDTPNTTLEVSLNGRLAKRFTALTPAPADSCSVTVTLNRGDNLIELGCAGGRAPDVDYMDARRL